MSQNPLGNCSNNELEETLMLASYAKHFISVLITHEFILL